MQFYYITDYEAQFSLVTFFTIAMIFLNWLLTISIKVILRSLIELRSVTATRLRFHGIVSGYIEAIPPGFLVSFFAANLFPDAVIPGMAKPSALSGALNLTLITSGSLATQWSNRMNSWWANMNANLNSAAGEDKR